MKRIFTATILLFFLLPVMVNAQKDRNAKFNINSAIGTYNAGKENYEDAIPNNFSLNEDAVAKGKFFVDLNYEFKDEWSAGFRYTKNHYDYYAEYYLGQDGWQGFFSLFGIEDYYADVANITTTQNDYCLYTGYRLTKSERRKVHVEVTAKGGLTYHALSQAQYIDVGIMSGSSYRGISNTYTQSSSGASLLLNMSCNLYLGKHFSFLIADLTQTVGVVNPTFNGSELSYGPKTVAIESHKLNLTSFSYGFGIGLHF